jgi:hypothetical protein
MSKMNADRDILIKRMHPSNTLTLYIYRNFVYKDIFEAILESN